MRTAAHHPLELSLAPRLRAGETLRGLFNGIPSPALVEMCGHAGFDFVILDNEHGSADLQTTEHQLRAARAVGLPALVRCFEADIPRVLDMGAVGVVVPMVQDVAQAQRLAAMTRYPAADTPWGRRGSAFSTRAAGYGAFGGAAHTERSNAGLLLMVMVETPEAAAHAVEIARVPGVDAVFVGPNDLAHAMGHGPRWQDGPVQALIQQVLREVAGAGRCAGTLALTAADEARYAACGARFFANVSTSLITRALQAAARGDDAAVSY